MDESDLTDFEKVNERGGIEKYTRTVQTPSSVEEVHGEEASRYSTGYASEENTMTVYVVRDADLLLKVSKVGTMGWSVSQHTLDGEIIDVGGPYMDEEMKAHSEARTAIEQEVAA